MSDWLNIACIVRYHYGNLFSCICIAIVIVSETSEYRGHQPMAVTFGLETSLFPATVSIKLHNIWGKLNSARLFDPLEYLKFAGNPTRGWRYEWWWDHGLSRFWRKCCADDHGGYTSNGEIKEILVMNRYGEREVKRKWWERYEVTVPLHYSAGSRWASSSARSRTAIQEARLSILFSPRRPWLCGVY
jgi:hypothetical protein